MASDTVRAGDGRLLDTSLSIDASLVRRLILEQFPQWAQLAVTPVEYSGWDNRTYRLGTDMVVRLPSAEPYRLQVEKEQRWLPLLAPNLPLQIPTPIARGHPAQGYPYDWSIYSWIEGEIATVDDIGNLSKLAITLAGFLQALQGVSTRGAPGPGPHNFFRGGPLETYDAETRHAVNLLGSGLDRRKATAIWDEALAASWTGPPVWVHGDIAAPNLLVRNGNLTGVIDFGCCGVGDPACDLAIAWTLLDATSRKAFRSALGLDDATWRRAKAWALWKAAITITSNNSQSGGNRDARAVMSRIMGNHI